MKCFVTLNHDGNASGLNYGDDLILEYVSKNDFLLASD